MYGQNKIAHKDDLSLQIKAKLKSSSKVNIDLMSRPILTIMLVILKTIARWELILEKNPKLSLRQQPTNYLDLSNQDSGTLSRVKEVLRDTGIDIRLETEMLSFGFLRFKQTCTNYRL